MSDFVLKAGLDLPIAGGVQSAAVETLAAPSHVAVTPPDYPGYKMRLAVKEGDVVQAGQPLGYAKLYPDMKFVSSAAGKVVEIRRGARRSIQAVVVEVAGEGAVDHGALSLEAVAGLGADGVKAQLPRRGRMADASLEAAGASPIRSKRPWRFSWRRPRPGRTAPTQRCCSKAVSSTSPLVRSAQAAGADHPPHPRSSRHAEGARRGH